MVNWQDMFSERAREMKASDIREAFKLTESPDIISFAGGFPSPEYFPVEEIKAITEEIMVTAPGAALQYGPTDGIGELRRQVAGMMTEEGMPVGPDQVLLTSGSQQGLDLIGKILLDPGDVILVEKPGYIGGLGALAAYQPVMEGIPLDEGGLRLDIMARRLEELSRQGIHPKLLYIVATFHNPTGVTMGLERRKELLALAEKYGFLIVEDNPYGEIYFDGKPTATLKSMDTTGQVIYLGSFSKIFLPGLRVGWMAGELPLMQKMTVAKQSMDLCGSTLSQKMVSVAIDRGFFPRHTPLLRRVYREKRDAMLASLVKYAPEGVTWTHPQGGFFVWVTLPEGMDAKLMLTEAVQEKVAYVSGQGFFIDGSGRNTIRLAYSQNSCPVIEEGIRRLCGVVEARMERSRAYATA